MNTLPPPTRTLAEQLDALTRGCGVRTTSDAVIAVRGGDRISWVSGMVTNEVKTLASGSARYAAVVQDKGKLLAEVWVLRRSEDLLLVVPGATVDALLAHFDAHVIMEDVEVARFDATVLTAVGATADVVFPGDGVRFFATTRLGRSGTDLLASNETFPRINAAVSSGQAVAVSDAAWATARIEAGVPEWGTDFGPENYVQEAGITRRAVSFGKGCYCGQEVVCRLEMRGHVRRQLVALHLPGTPVARGTAVGDAGTVTSSAPAANPGESVAIAMVKWDVASVARTLEVAGRTARVVRIGAGAGE